MPITLPYIPETITVHLGSPGSNAANVTVPFANYVKNVVSSEIYPSWERSAISANTLAIISYALNRVYTEYYRSRGYNFDITNSTAIDQKFIQGRNIFENVSLLVDTLFDDYIRRQGFVEPLAAKFCNGTTVTCAGMSQWGSQQLAQGGSGPFAILQNYYGNNIEIVNNAPVRGVSESYPGTPLRVGSTGNYVRFLQTELNRISQNYPAIPKITVDGIFGPKTEEAVETFQRVFSLTADGIVGRTTWYRIVQIYVGVLGLAELQSQGLDYSNISWGYPDAIVRGDNGIKVSHLQYMLAVLSNFIEEVPPVTVTGNFGDSTLSAVEGFQRYANLPINGVVDAKTWDAIYSQFAGIEGTVFGDAELFPFSETETAAQSIAQLQSQLQTISSGNPSIPVPGNSGSLDGHTRCSIGAFQQQFGLTRNCTPNEETRRTVAETVNRTRYQCSSRFVQYPHRTLSAGMKDQEICI